MQTVLGIIELLTCVDELVGPGEEIGRCVVLVCIEGQRDGPVQRHPPAWGNRPAVSPPECGVHQLARLQRCHFRVDVHILVHASEQCNILAFNSLVREQQFFFVFSDEHNDLNNYGDRWHAYVNA